MKATILAVLVVINFSIGAQEAYAGESSSLRSEFKLALVAISDTAGLVPGADIGFSWGRIGGERPDTDNVRMIGDENGAAEFGGTTKYDSYAYGAVKEGYYPTRGVKGEFLPAVNGRWQPWAQRLSVVIKPIKNPVPMYAKHIITSLPANDVWVGYDLELGDWVSPHGAGKRADFEFQGTGTISNRLNYKGTLRLRLPGDGNGILTNQMDTASGSELRMPYEAPFNGYEKSWEWKHARITEDKPHAVSSFIDESYPGCGFIFRVRSVLDAQGQVIRAWYGKIPGPFIVDPRGEDGHVFANFTYYLNPDGTRNLEFDPKRNLLKNLKSDERVHAP